jgi:hypothetical protein
LEYTALKERTAFQEILVHQDHPDHRDRKDHEDRTVIKDQRLKQRLFLVLQATLAILVHGVHLVIQVCPAVVA